MTLAIFTVSCEDDGGTSAIELIEGAVPNMIKSESTDGFLDLTKIQAGQNVSISFSADIAQGDPASGDVVGVYTTVAGDVYNATLDENVSFPADYTLSANDIVAAFSELTSLDDLGLGDVLSITTRFTLDNGTVLNIINPDGTSNTGSNIRSTVLFTTVINYPVSCPSDLAGTYNVLSSGFSTDSGPANNPIVDFPYTVTITDDGGGAYTISDGVAGIYIEWYSIYGYSFETPGNFTDVCGNLSGSWSTSFTGDTVELTGVVNEDGTLTVSWINAFGDEVTEATYTPM